jgi:hypothetical protein
MSKQEIFAEIVNELTEIADVIRHHNGNKKLTTDPHATKEKYSQWFSWSLEYRLRHIAYSELRGKTREQIEQPDRKKLQAWDEQAIIKHKERYSEIIKAFKMENSPLEVSSE